MSLPLFIARRLYRGEQDKRWVSRPAVLIAKLGIAIGLAVMLIAVSVVTGFKKEVRDKIVGFGGHIQVTNLAQMQLYEPLPVGVDEALLNQLAAMPGVKHVQRFSYKPGLVKTADAFQGMEFDIIFLSAVRTTHSLPRHSAPNNKNTKNAGMQIFGFLTSENRLCVALSRQKKMLIVVGDGELFGGPEAGQYVPALKNFYDLCREEGAVQNG